MRKSEDQKISVYADVHGFCGRTVRVPCGEREEVHVLGQYVYSFSAAVKEMPKGTICLNRNYEADVREERVKVFADAYLMAVRGMELFQKLGRIFVTAPDL